MKTKVTVFNEQGREVNPYVTVEEMLYTEAYERFEATVERHPAPGIDNGTHECELKDEYWSYNASCWCKTDYPIYYLGGGYRMRQIWVLAEQEKEGMPEYKLKAIEKLGQIYLCPGYERMFCTEEIFVRTDVIPGYPVTFNIKIGEIVEPKDVYLKDGKYYLSADKPTQSSTRIAELSARVAELEGVLKEIAQSSDPGSYERAIIDMKILATNALKNQQP